MKLARVLEGRQGASHGLAGLIPREVVPGHGDGRGIRGKVSGQGVLGGTVRRRPLRREPVEVGVSRWEWP